MLILDCGGLRIQRQRQCLIIQVIFCETLISLLRLRLIQNQIELESDRIVTMYAQLTRINCTRDNCKKSKTAGNRKHCFSFHFIFISDDFKTLRLDCYQCETGSIPKQFTEVESVRFTVKSCKMYSALCSNHCDGRSRNNFVGHLPLSPCAIVLAKKEL